MNSRELRELQDEQGAELGGARRCVVHPNQTMSSPDGMFDNPCRVCEAEQNEEEYRAQKARHLQGCQACGCFGKDEDGRLWCACNPERYAQMHPDSEEYEQGMFD